MSSTTTVTRPTEPSTIALPIEPLATDFAKIYIHIHPFLLLSLYIYRFDAIVGDPVSTLPTLLVGSVGLQLVYILTCLPPTTAGTKSNPPMLAKIGLKKKRTKQNEQGYGDKVIPAVLSLILTALLGVPLIYIFVVLFGGPLTTHFLHTFFCAAHIAFLAVLPLVYVFGVDSGRWRELAGLLIPLDDVVGGALGTVFGAWVGAVPIPLDWDREWQKWPVTIVTGAYGGYVMGKLLGGQILKGKVIEI
ncbi:GPI-anchor biosynthesis protein-like protein [Patellaria atrata CBS 101060]|uniref:GPI-anchor biosynthesis protein-like protein n=1 Tax=Patellaria atrata CBS 101060 TaxID=1346257 RepID=A0A9P4S4F4_9PEZI|nr:GPI-anchor biosynthesis protein-like protein [Patellaria atrata CBS 101060]